LSNVGKLEPVALREPARRRGGRTELAARRTAGGPPNHGPGRAGAQTRAGPTDQACAAALEFGLPNNPYRFVRRWLERHPAPTLRQVDPIIRQLNLYRDLIDQTVRFSPATTPTGSTSTAMARWTPHGTLPLPDTIAKIRAKWSGGAFPTTGRRSEGEARRRFVYGGHWGLGSNSVRRVLERPADPSDRGSRTPKRPCLSPTQTPSRGGLPRLVNLECAKRLTR
jgi:hypothetical protein